MTASITTVQQALQDAIEDAAKDNQFALPLSVCVADSAASPPPSPDDAMDVQLAFVASAQLARSTNRVLDQAVINVNLTYRHPDNDQANLDQCHLVSQQLRDLLGDFTATGVRVEQILTQSPLDATAALQGIYNNKIGLDLDIVRSLRAYAPVTIDPKPQPTAVREAVWDAINNWAPFENVWVRKFQTMEDLEELALHDPGAAELPAIAVTWGPIDAKWWVNDMQQWTHQLFVAFWLPADQLDVAELRLLQLQQAIYQSAPVGSPGVSYIRRAVGRPPTKNSPVSLDQVTLGRSQQLHAWRGQIALALTANLDPND